MPETTVDATLQYGEPTPRQWDMQEIIMLVKQGVRRTPSRRRRRPFDGFDKLTASFAQGNRHRHGERDLTQSRRGSREPHQTRGSGRSALGADAKPIPAGTLSHSGVRRRIGKGEVSVTRMPFSFTEKMESADENGRPAFARTLRRGTRERLTIGEFSPRIPSLSQLNTLF